MINSSFSKVDIARLHISYEVFNPSPSYPEVIMHPNK